MPPPTLPPPLPTGSPAAPLPAGRAASSLTPVAPGDRIDSLDILRGIALFGILLMNIESFAGPMLIGVTGVDPALQGVDRAVDTAIYLLVQGKFYVIFSLLFGMGFALMHQRAQAAGRMAEAAFLPLYLRRLATLLAIGLAHALLVWSGDILVTYALVALPMALLLRDLPTRLLPWLAVALLAVAPAILFGLGLLGWLSLQMPEAAEPMRAELAKQAAEVQALIASERAAYGPGGGWPQAVAHRARELAFLSYNLIVVFWQVLGLFLLGAWCLRSGAIRDPQAWPRFHAAMRWGALPLGAAAMWVSYGILPTMPFDRMDLQTGTASALQIVAGPLMGLGYVSWMLRMLPALRWAAPAGRMALTNYLMQSVVCTLIFYGYGLGYFERLPRAWQPAFVLALFLAQVLVSHAWLARFRFGPMEWLWRGVTYGRLPALRRSRG